MGTNRTLDGTAIWVLTAVSNLHKLYITRQNLTSVGILATGILVSGTWRIISKSHETTRARSRLNLTGCGPSTDPRARAVWVPASSARRILSRDVQFVEICHYSVDLHNCFVYQAFRSVDSPQPLLYLRLLLTSSSLGDFITIRTHKVAQEYCRRKFCTKMYGRKMKIAIFVTVWHVFFECSAKKISRLL